MIRTGDTYAWTGHGNGSTAYTQNGLNQQVTIGGSSASWDSKGNLTSEPQSGKTYGYSSENLLTSASGGVTLAYDPERRLYQVAAAATTRSAYDGLDTIAEYDGSNALQRRYVFGPGMDEPIVQYEGMGTTDRRFMSGDERGSIISLTDSSGTLLNINRYDEYGKPQSTNTGRFQYTGQKWIAEANLYDYKARAYLPHLGIFAQTDPIGYEDSTNLYTYVLDDPVNLSDPLGLQCDPQQTGSCAPIDIVGRLGAPGGAASIGGGAARAGGGAQVPGDSSLPPSVSSFLDNLIVTDPQRPTPFVTCDVEDCSTGVKITGTRGRMPFVLVGGKNLLDPRFKKPRWSNEFDACFVVCPIVIGGGAAVAVTGWEFVIANGVRIAPLGNRGPGRFRWPHYHRRGNAPGQGIKRHRPWETKTPDTSFWDRF